MVSAPLLRAWIHCPRAPEQFVASPLCLVGYVRWGARSDRVPPLQTIIFSSFTGRTPVSRPRGQNLVSCRKRDRGLPCAELERVRFQLVSFCSLLVSELLCGARRGDDPVAHRVVDYLGQRMEAKLDHDLNSVRLNRPDGDSQLRGDLLVRFPFCQEANDFKLAGSCSGACPLPMLMLAISVEKSLQHDFGYFKGEETLALCNGLHGFRKALREIGFQEVPASPRLQGAAYHLV